MAEASDPFWQAASAHVSASGVPAGAVFAPAGFEPLLPGCCTIADARAVADFTTVILHKGRLGDVPADILVNALENLAATFANEVFIVLSRHGAQIAPDSPHLMSREALLAAALRDAERKAVEARSGRSGRMPAAYLGQGRVLLETAFGHLMLVDGADTGIVPHLIRDGWFDRNLTNVIGSLLKPGMTFIDIGANFGTYTLFGAGRVGEHGRVIAIEASPAIAALLHESVLMNGFADYCDVLRCAAGAEEGTVLLHQFATRKGSSTMLAHIAEVAQAEYGETITAQQVDCRTLDSIVEDLALERIDLVKIDVEGVEYEVLRGARAALIRHRPRLVFEWHSSFFAGREGVAQALYALMTGELGYSLHRIEADGKTRPIAFDELMIIGHSDLVAEPVA